VKNRFGSTNEIGIFEMAGSGLAEVANPSELFLGREAGAREGCVVTPSFIGSRTLLIEIQALTTPGAHPEMVSRRVSGVDRDRMMLVLAVLGRRCGFATSKDDVFVNAVGGVRINEPAADLAILLAVHSSLIGRPLPPKTLVFGEVGLAGEVRPVQRGQERIREAAKLGFRQVVIPNLNKPKQAIDNIKIVTADRVDQALALLR
jgi:DNA repair protein RadA/Sms